MRNTLALIVTLFAVLSLDAVAQNSAPWDERYRTMPEAEAIGQYMAAAERTAASRRFGLHEDNVEWMRSKLTEWGWDARIESYDVLFPTPKERLLEMIAPTRFKATLEEPAVPVDPTSGQKAEQLPTYNVYSIDGDVTAPLVYVNYGRPEDYEELDALGVSVRGAIVIARYGGSFRGTKPKIAAEHGAIGCLIYSDPRDDGYFADAVFPDGPMRSKDGVQRGSVMDLPTYSGDPLTPGAAAVPGAHAAGHQRRADAHEDSGAADFLRRCAAAARGDARAGRAGGVARRAADHLSTGPGPTQVHLKVAFNWDTKPLYDVIATIPGSTFPDEWIVRGNHHDAWVNGASDPVSGMAPELEEARALGQLREAGLAAEAHDRLCRVGWRRAGAARLDRVGRAARSRSCARRRSSTSTATATVAGFSRRAARTRSSSSSTTWRAASRIRRRRARCGSAGRRARSPKDPADTRAEAARAPTCESARSDPGRTTRRSCSITARRR